MQRAACKLAIDKIQNTHISIRHKFRSVKCTFVTRICKNFEQLFVLMYALQGDYSMLM